MRLASGSDGLGTTAAQTRLITPVVTPVVTRVYVQLCILPPCVRAKTTGGSDAAIQGIVTYGLAVYNVL